MSDEKNNNNRKFGRDRANAIFDSHVNDQSVVPNNTPIRGKHVAQMGPGIDARHSQMKGAAPMNEIMSQQKAAKPAPGSQLQSPHQSQPRSHPEHNNTQGRLQIQSTVNQHDEQAHGASRSTLTITPGKSQNESKPSSFFQSFVTRQNQKHSVGRAFSLLDSAHSVFSLGGDAAKKGLSQLQNMRTQDEAGREYLRPFFDPDNNHHKSNQQNLRIDMSKKHSEAVLEDERRGDHGAQSQSQFQPQSQSQHQGFFQPPMSAEEYLNTDKGKAIQGFAKDLVGYARQRQQATGSSHTNLSQAAQEQRITSSVKTHKNGTTTQTLEIQKTGKPDMNRLLQLGMLATKGAAAVSGADARQSTALNNQMQKLGALLGTAQKFGVFNNQSNPPKSQKLTITMQQQEQQQSRPRSNANAINNAPKSAPSSSQPKSK